MFPHERSLVSRLSNKPFVLLGVNTDPSVEKVKEDNAKNGITWRSWYDGSTRGPISRQLAVRAFPTLYLIDHKGVVRQKFIGAPNAKKLDVEIDKLVKEAEKG